MTSAAETGSGPLPSSAENLKPGEAEVELALYRQAVERCRADLQAFAHSVSHDLRAPLRAIQGFSKILVEDYAGQLEPEASQFLRHIIQNTQLLSAQMDDLLRFSRAGKAPPAKIEIDAAELVQQTIDQLRPNLPANFTIETGDLPQIVGDPALLGQVFAELIGNAAKFTSKKPEPKVRITGREDAHAASILFRDNGVGFNPAHTSKLFQVFQKLHSPAEFPGNGIGLAIVKRIIEAHGGCVEAAGLLDQGAQIEFALPRSSTSLPLQCLPKNGPRANSVEISA